MWCWHNLWFSCVSSKAVGHSLVTQGELLISRERDVLASASGSFEDKQRVDGVVVGSATERSSESFKGGHAEVSLFPFLCPLHWAHARGQAGSRSVPGLCTSVRVEPRPLVNPLTSEHTLVEVVETVM